MMQIRDSNGGLEQESNSGTTEDSEREAIAQRIAQFEATMALIASIPSPREAAGLGPLPDNIRELAYEENSV